MTTLRQRIRQKLQERDLTQAELARLVGVKQQTISYICKSEAVAQTSRYATQIAAALGVNPVWLQTGEGNAEDLTVPVSRGGIVVKAMQLSVLTPDQVVSRVTTGKSGNAGNLMSDCILRGTGFALEVEGDSMAPTFRTGDRVVIDEALSPEPGDYVAALLDQNVLLFRRYRLRGDGFELTPENPDWDKVSSSPAVKIIGVMVEHRRYRRRQ